MAAADPSKFSALAAWSRWVRLSLTLAWACLAALACMALNTPLPWMIGPLLATALAGIAGVPLATAAPLRMAGLWTIGTSLGLYFMPHVVATVVGNAGSLIVGVAWALSMGVLFAAFLWRTNPQIAGLDRASTFFSSALGGAAEMVAMADLVHLPILGGTLRAAVVRSAAAPCGAALSIQARQSRPPAAPAGGELRGCSASPGGLAPAIAAGAGARR